jgi:hypothetical protein
VLAAHAGRVEVVAERGPHSGKTVGHDGHAQAGATDQNSPVELSPGDLLGPTWPQGLGLVSAW